MYKPYGLRFIFLTGNSLRSLFVQRTDTKQLHFLVWDKPVKMFFYFITIKLEKRYLARIGIWFLCNINFDISVVNCAVSSMFSVFMKVLYIIKGK